VWVATTYDEGAKELVHKLKFEHAMAAAKPITELMAEALPYLPEGIVIVHVPTATSRRRQRGYDQAELLARHLARRLRRRCMTLLARRGQSRQVGARRMQRTTQLVDAFHPIRPSLIQGAHILLVDDIVTTGASLEAAARVLKQAGAKRIDAVVFAQKI
jgi:ComF family protein